jgi:hypothetical protein
LTFTVGAVAAGALVYAAFGTLRLLLSPSWPLHGLALAALLGALVWHVCGRHRIPWGRESVQARRPTAERGWPGLLYFGALLGVGLLTEMARPLVLAGAVMAAAQGVLWCLTLV